MTAEVGVPHLAGPQLPCIPSLDTLIHLSPHPSPPTRLTPPPPFQGSLPPETANFRHPLPTPRRPLRASSGTTPRVVLCSHRTPRAAARAAAIFTFSNVHPAHAQRRVTVAEQGQTRSLKPKFPSQAGQALNNAVEAGQWAAGEVPDRQQGEKTKPSAD